MFRVIHPNTELRFVSPSIGYGVFATERIPRGTITWVRCAFDRTLTPEQAKALDPFYAPILDKYAYVDSRGDSVLCWDLGRFMNHSCASTCLSPGFDFDLAVSDIEIGEQLTCDYVMLNLDEPFACDCGVLSCRKTIAPADWEVLAEPWDVRLRAVFDAIPKNEQPLWELVKEKERVIAAATGREPVPSCRTHRYRRPQTT